VSRQGPAQITKRADQVPTRRFYEHARLTVYAEGTSFGSLSGNRLPALRSSRRPAHSDSIVKQRGGCAGAFSRRESPELCVSFRPPDEQRAQGRPGAGWHPWPPVPHIVHRMHRGNDHRWSRDIPAFPAQWFTAYSALSPVSRALLPPSSLRSLLLTNLTPASGARTTRLRRPFQPRSSVAAYASTASHRTFVTTAIRPSHRVRRAESNH
jgi:hypothetical protein